LHSVVSVAQLSQVASGPFGSGGGRTSMHGFDAVPPLLTPPLLTPPLLTPPLLTPPPFMPPTLPLDPATWVAPAVPIEDPALPVTPPPELSAPAVLLGCRPLAIPALEAVPDAAAGNESSVEQPPVANSAVDQKAAHAHTRERR
jgi:hypothetical protein